MQLSLSEAERDAAREKAEREKAEREKTKQGGRAKGQRYHFRAKLQATVISRHGGK